MSREKPSLPTLDDIDELVAFLPKLYADGFEAQKEMRIEDYPDGSVSFPHAIYDPLVHEFMQKASQDCWCDFEYSRATSGQPLNDPAHVAIASIDEIKSMLTWCIRGERFCDGHVGAMIEEGKIRMLLERLIVLREKLL